MSLRICRGKQVATGMRGYVSTASTCHAERSAFSLFVMLSEAKHPQVDSCARMGKVNPCAIRLICVFRVLWLYGFLATLGMTFLLLSC